MWSFRERDGNYKKEKNKQIVPELQSTRSRNFFP